jgi:hypothetical protein
LEQARVTDLSERLRRAEEVVSKVSVRERTLKALAIGAGIWAAVATVLAFIR